MGIRLEKGPSPLKLKMFETLLRSYPNQMDWVFLWGGFNYGFRILFARPQVGFMANNLSSFKAMEPIVWDKISKEFREGFGALLCSTLYPH